MENSEEALIDLILQAAGLSHSRSNQKLISLLRRARNHPGSIDTRNAIDQWVREAKRVQDLEEGLEAIPPIIVSRF